MMEPQPPAWWEPPKETFPPSRPPQLPSRPRYRELRPVRWPMVMLGIGGALVWFVVVGIAASASRGTLLAGTLAAVALASVVTWVLAWKGDVGLSIGVAVIVGFVLAVTMTLGGSWAFSTVS
jgi:hypothetical protein